MRKRVTSLPILATIGFSPEAPTWEQRVAAWDVLDHHSLQHDLAYGELGKKLAVDNLDSLAPKEEYRREGEATALERRSIL